MEREGPRQHPAHPGQSELDPVAGGWAGSRWSTPAALRVVEDDWPAEPTAQRGAYDPTIEIRDGWRSITTGGRGGAPAPVAARVAVVLDALYWAYRDGDEVWVAARTSHQRPAGGVLHPVDKRCIRATAAACFKDLTGGREVASTSALAAAQVAWEGTAAPLGEPTWLRWGRDSTGGLWWDPGGSDDRCVKIDRDGWQVAERPGCWFRRPGAFPVMPLPETGGDVDELWRFVPCEPADRPLVLAWMLAATQPDPDFAAGVLYLTGSEGTAKTTSAETIARVAGAPPNPPGSAATTTGTCSTRPTPAGPCSSTTCRLSTPSRATCSAPWSPGSTRPYAPSTPPPTPPPSPCAGRSSSPASASPGCAPT